MAQKDASVAELTKHFENSTAVLLTEYRGLTVAQLKQLRNDIRQDAEYAVVKNTLTKIAAANAGVTGLDAIITEKKSRFLIGGIGNSKVLQIFT